MYFAMKSDVYIKPEAALVHLFTIAMPIITSESRYLHKPHDRPNSMLEKSTQDHRSVEPAPSMSFRLCWIEVTSLSAVR